MTLADQAVIDAVKREFQGRQIFKITESRPEAGTVINVGYKRGKFNLLVEYSDRRLEIPQDKFRLYALR